MGEHSASSVGNSQEWKEDLAESSEHPANHDIPKCPNAALHSQMMASTVCCSKADCDQVKLELMPEQFFRFEPVQTSAFGMDSAESRDPPTPPPASPLSSPSNSSSASASAVAASASASASGSVSALASAPESASTAAKDKMKKEGATVVHRPEPLMPFCPCALNGGQLVTYCCMRPDCDEASKIPGVRERRTYTHFKF